MAFLVVLESTTPAERVAFVLHDVFRYSFAEVAEVVGRTPGACRQLASSARRRVREAQTPEAPDATRAGIVRAFKQAWEGKRHRRPDRPAGPRRHRDRRRRRPRPRLTPPRRRGRADRQFAWVEIAAPGRRRHDVPGAYGQRSARPGGPAGRPRRGGAGVRRRGRPDQEHLGRSLTPTNSAPGRPADACPPSSRPSTPLHQPN